MNAVNIPTGSGSYMLSPLNGKLKDVKTLHEGGKTYVIIVKNNNKVSVSKSASHVSSSVCINQQKADVDCKISPSTRIQLGSTTKDRVKRSLANICDESEDEELYTSSAELAEVFGVSSKEQYEKETEITDRGGNLVKTEPRSPVHTGKTRSCVQYKHSEDLKPFSKRPHLTRSVINSTDDAEANLTLNRKLFASPTPGNDAGQFTELSNKTPSDNVCQRSCTITPDFIRHAYKTPTPELPVNKFGAVRKIFVVQESPSCPKSSTPKQKSAGKSVTSPRIILTPKGPSCSTPLGSPRIVTSRPVSHGGSPQTTIIQITNVPTDHQIADQKLSKQPAEDPGGKSVNLDDSLTNIQWLGGLASEGLVPKTKAGAVPNGKEIERVSLECGRQKRPAYSYMMLIRMAMNSREDKKMTLREICKWIEDTFPFYKYTAKPGWRNSIRHNLSVYDIFVRIPSNPKQHGSHWTVKESNSKKMKYSKSSQNKEAQNCHSTIPTHVLSSMPFLNTTAMGMNQLNMANFSANQSTAQPQQGPNKKKTKKGPTPILPRPPVMLRNSSVMPPGGALQTYALIPISSLSSALQPSTSQVSMVPGPNPVTVSLAVDSGTLHNQNPVSQGNDPLTATFTALNTDTTGPTDRRVYTSNVIKEAWQTAGCMDADMPIRGLTANEEQSTKMSKVKPGLPKPKMYSTSKSKSKSGPKGKKSVKKSKSIQRNSTPVKPVGLISESQLDNDIEDGLPTPLRQLLDTPASEPGMSSTPSKCLTDSPKWLSPIAGFTPGRYNGLPDGSFLDFLPNNSDCDSPTIVTPVKSLEAWLKIATGLMDTPNTSLLQVNPADLSPLCGVGGESEVMSKDVQHSISHLLAEIDPCLVDELDNSQFNLSSLNWANPFQST